ncbi:MAG: hypothetical protein ACFCUR_18495 [Rhodomicrobiaceae bacterium]
MTRISRMILAAVPAIFFAGTVDDAKAAYGSSPDWPCIQREVPQISAGMVWPGDPLDAEDRSWLQNQAVANVVQKLASRRNSVEDALKIADEFAANLEENRKDTLEAVFIGTLQRVNAERRQVVAGIKRYARRQAALADLIREKSLEEARLVSQSPKTDDEKQRLVDLSEEIAWDTRVYEEREQSLTYVCETAVLLEQRLFQIGRHMSGLIKQ